MPDLRKTTTAEHESLEVLVFGREFEVTSFVDTE